MKTQSDKASPGELFTDPQDTEFWEGVNRHELLLFHCEKCGAYYWPATTCQDCGLDNMHWVPSTGHGTLHTFTIYYRALNPAWKDDVPYNVGVVELDEGPFMFTNVVGIPNEDLKVGMRLQVTFNEVRPGVTLPQFEPARS